MIYEMECSDSPMQKQETETVIRRVKHGLLMSIWACIALMLILLATHCSPSMMNREAQFALQAAQIACALATAETNSARVADVCHIDAALTPALEALLKGKAGAQKAGSCK